MELIMFTWTNCLLYRVAIASIAPGSANVK